MSREHKKMINASKCEECEYGSTDDSNRARITIYCSKKNKKYFYGQYIPCDDFNKKQKEDIE